MSCICFGSFGVPIKHPSVLRARVHPLVFQSYKTTWVLLTCPVALFFVDKPQFTWWGIVSGAFWVPGGIAAVVSVTNVGLAVGQGTWSVLIVMVSFSWGAFYFHEPLHSLPASIMAVLLLMFGLVGMSCFAVSKVKDAHNKNTHSCEAGIISGKNKYSQVIGYDSAKANSSGVATDATTPSPTLVDESLTTNMDNHDHADALPFGMSRARYGLCAAIFNGLWGGSSMVPLKLVSQVYILHIYM